MYDLNNMWNLKGKKKFTKRSDLWLPEVGWQWEGEIGKGDQKIQPPVTRQVSTRDVLYNMMTMVNTAIGYTGKLLRM